MCFPGTTTRLAQETSIKITKWKAYMRSGHHVDGNHAEDKPNPAEVAPTVPKAPTKLVRGEQRAREHLTSATIMTLSTHAITCWPSQNRVDLMGGGSQATIFSRQGAPQLPRCGTGGGGGDHVRLHVATLLYEYE